MSAHARSRRKTRPIGSSTETAQLLGDVRHRASRAGRTDRRSVRRSLREETVKALAQSRRGKQQDHQMQARSRAAAASENAWLFARHGLSSFA
eukprot:3255509-Prymnesium_polylepis.1